MAQNWREHLHELVHLAVAGMQQLLYCNILHPAPQPPQHSSVRPLALSRDTKQLKIAY